jgi:uncharacterized membrane protein
MQLGHGLTALAALAVAVVLGVFFAFSTFVAQALARLPAADAVHAMQSVNVVILGSAFVPVFSGAVPLTALACITSWGTASPLVRLALGAAFAIYAVGVFGVTLRGNVPLNDALMAFRDGDARAAWDAFYGPWLRLNHVRSFASAASLVALLVALRAG